MSAITSGKKLFSGATGRWATAQFKAAAMSGKALSAASLRTLDTLRHEEWKYFDDQLVKEATIRLVGVADLISLGLTRPVPNSLGKTIFGYEKVTDMDPATTSLDGISRSDNDRQEFDDGYIPLPITHKDFFINLRVLAASRESGTPLDTLQVSTAGRVVTEQLEKMLFRGGPTFGGNPIYGYETFPDANDGTYIANGDWAQTAKTGENILQDLQKALTALKADRMYGPYGVYVPSDADVKLSSDFKSFSDKTIRQRLLEVEGIQFVHTADQLTTGKVVVVQLTADVVAWVQGEPLQAIQWDEYGGFEVNFKAFTIGAPLLRSDAQGRCGIYILHT